MSHNEEKMGFVEQALYKRRIQLVLANSTLLERGQEKSVSISFPISQSQIKKAFRQIGIKVGENNWEIIGIDSDIPNIEYLDNHSDLNEFNTLAEQAIQCKEEDWDKFCAIIESEYESPSTLEEYIDLLYNLDCFGFYPNATNEKQLGKVLITQSDAIGNLTTFKKLVSPFVVYGELGKRIVQQTDGEFTSYGYIYETNKEWHDAYHREDFYDEAVDSQLVVDENNCRIR